MFPFLNIQAQTIPSDSIKEPVAVITETIKNVINTPTEQLIANSIDIAPPQGRARSARPGDQPGLYPLRRYRAGADPHRS